MLVLTFSLLFHRVGIARFAGDVLSALRLSRSSLPVQFVRHCMVSVLLLAVRSRLHHWSALGRDCSGDDATGTGR